MLLQNEQEYYGIMAAKLFRLHKKAIQKLNKKTLQLTICLIFKNYQT